MVLGNEGYLKSDIPLLFNPRTVMAIAADMPRLILDQARDASYRIAEISKAKLFVSCKRPWGKSFGSGFTDAIQDICHIGLFKVGDPHQRPLDLNTFSESWELLDQKS